MGLKTLGPRLDLVNLFRSLQPDIQDITFTQVGAWKVASGLVVCVAFGARLGLRTAERESPPAGFTRASEP